MTLFEDPLEIHYNAKKADAAVVDGPASIETIHEALERFEQHNDRTDATIVVDMPTATDMDRCWTTRRDSITGPYDQFDPVDGVVSLQTQLGQPAGLVLRSNAVDLDMQILDPDGVVAIDFERGESTDD